MNPPPPPPPPHGENPKSSGLPPGKYDIFIIPPHSSGSGFLYLPSLKPNVNSFAAGFASALILVVIGSALAPAVQAWWNSVKGSGGMGMIMLILAIGVGAWALGRSQNEGGPGPGGGDGSGPSPGGASGSHSNSQHNAHSNGYANAPPPGPTPGAGPAPGAAGSAGGPKPSWQQRANPPPGASGASAHNTADGSAKGAWERAREETKKKEEERKAKEAEKKRKEELEKRLKEAREREAREREAREREAREKGAREREAREREAREREAREREKGEREAREREAREREAREREAREKKLKDEEAAKERKRKEDELAREKKRKEDEAARERKRLEDDKPRSSTYAYSSTGERTNPWPKGRPASPSATRSNPPSPTKKPPVPTAKTYLGTEEDAYSYRPYDKPKKPIHKKSHSSLYSESSYAASQSTARTTPPPSHRGPYSTKDPDKIVIKAVYAFNNAFLKTPTSQLVSGVGSVTDGLILRITTEGLFIDDDVRGVPQREWDVKAWTMKLVEVWCPSFRQGPAGNSASARVASNGSPLKYNPVRRLWGLDKEKAASSEETDALLVDMLQLCKNNCRLRASSSASSAYSASTSSYDGRSSVSDSAYGSSVGSSSPSRDMRTDKHGVPFQTGELKSAKLHVLRASIRDQEGRKYVFVITEEESWKVTVGLQRLRKGTQVRALGVSGMSAGDARSTLENLGWG
jgi:hypothetical protein